jgi:methyltransferase (TIGR00027 family)
MEPNEDNPVPFTARLTAYHRAQEAKQPDPLVQDPFAEILAGDLERYARDHGYAIGKGDYTIVRTRFIDHDVIGPWCKTHRTSQIVLLGAGLDARALRLDILQSGEHSVFEVDYPEIITYKERVLPSEDSPVPLVRLSADISSENLIHCLCEKGYNKERPTLWILEGIAYYLEKRVIRSILLNLAHTSTAESRVFADVCVPGLAEAKFGPFMMHFKWGINPDDITSFFSSAGWDVTHSFADDHDKGRDVGQRGLLFVTGQRMQSLGKRTIRPVEEQTVELEIRSSRARAVALGVRTSMAPLVKLLIESYTEKPDKGFEIYQRFIEEQEPTVRQLVEAMGNPVSVSKVSPRLLRDPRSFFEREDRSPDEEMAHMIGYLEALISLVYCGLKGLDGHQFAQTNMFAVRQAAEERDLMFIEALLNLLNDEQG